jgi:hypothetical protein
MEKIYPILHAVALLYVAWNIINADILGLAWFRGKVATLDKKKITKYHHGTWLGIILMIITGGLIYSTVADKVLYPQFCIKMMFVLIIVINSIVIGKLLSIPTTKSFKSVTKRERNTMLISAALSFISWGGAIIAAAFILAE